MLKKEIWKSIFDNNQISEGSAFDFYADSWTHRSLSFENKKLSLKTSETGGARVLTQKDHVPQSFQSSVLIPELFFAFIDRKDSFPLHFESSGSPKVPPTSPSQDIFLEQTFRRLLLEVGTEDLFTASFEEHHKDFIVAHEQNELRQGTESVARFHLNFVLRKGNRTKTFSFQKGTTEIPVLLNELENWSFSKELLEKGLEKPWPAPKGKLALHWSSQSVAKFGACFLKMLEFFSRDPELLSSLAQLCRPLGFQLIENWKSETKIDVEGKVRVPTILVNGKESLTAFNENLPGFARRQTYSHFPITAPWEPAIFGLERSSNLLSQMRDGISIGDVELKNFHIPSGKLDFEIQESVLVHQGVKGEFIEPVTLRVDLIDLLRSFKLFSEKTSPTPLDWNSWGQNLFVEFTAPEALSPQFELPGTVPLTHYW